MQVMKTSSTLLGLEFPDTLSSMASFALTYLNQSRWKKTEELAVLIIKTKKRMPGLEHSQMLNNMANLALTHLNQDW